MKNVEKFCPKTNRDSWAKYKYQFNELGLDGVKFSKGFTFDHILK